MEAAGAEAVGGRGGVQPPSAGARGMAGTDTTDAAWHKHEQMILMESRHKQQHIHIIRIMGINNGIE
uniref:Dual-specificity tyrosine-(Y)-phosphorylation regulated kinase n=1 Tax=Apis cerana TaxID=7461 RepID=V9IC39_APICE